MRGKTSSLPKVLTSRLGFQEEAMISWLRGWKESEQNKLTQKPQAGSWGHRHHPGCSTGHGRLQGRRRHPGLRRYRSSLRLRFYLKYPRSRTRAELSGNGQGRLACYSPWGHRGLDTTVRLNNNNNFYSVFRAFATSVVSEKITTFWGDKLCSPSRSMRIHRRQG